MKKINFGLMNLRYYMQEIGGELYLVDKDAHLLTFLLGYVRAHVQIKMYKLNEDTIKSLIGNQEKEEIDYKREKQKGLIGCFILFFITKIFSPFNSVELEFVSRMLIIVIPIVIALIFRWWIRQKTKLDNFIEFGDCEMYSIRFFFKKGEEFRDYARLVFKEFISIFFQFLAFGFMYLIILGVGYYTDLTVCYVITQWGAFTMNYLLNDCMPFAVCNYKIKKCNK